MKKRKTNIKIKPRKYSLYSRKKNKGKQALAAVLTVVAAAALCVVGYGVGKPIVEYFQTKQNTPVSSVPWIPTAEETVQPSSSEEALTVEAETSEPEPEQPSLKGAYFLPETAALSSESLNSAMAAAKSNGAESVVVTLKDDAGYLLYKTENEAVSGTEIVSGTLSARQIADIITRAGLVPIAKISTTKDHIGGNYVDGNYIISGEGGIWHDDAVDKGGKRWLNPFNENTVEYIASLAGEISNAGFKQIILSDTVFPMFHTSDFSTWLYSEPIGDNAARLQALWNVIGAAESAAKANGAQILVEMTSESLFAEDRLSTGAEVANDAEKLSRVTLLLDYEAAGGSYADARSFIGRTKVMLAGQDYAVRIKGSSFSAGALDDVKRAFAEAGIMVFTE